MVSRRIPAVLAGVLLGSLLAVRLTSSPARAGTRAQLDNDDYDDRCVRFDRARGYVDTWGSARKYSRASWNERSPAATTGDWFDTTYDLVVFR